jgi:hypothetical protein
MKLRGLSRLASALHSWPNKAESGMLASRARFYKKRTGFRGCSKNSLTPLSCLLFADSGDKSFARGWKLVSQPMHVAVGVGLSNFLDPEDASAQPALFG